MKTTKGISAAVLKWAAAVTMLIDHIGASVVLREMYMNQADIPYELYEGMRLVGRLAFPLFCFLLVESFYHTRSRVKMTVRLFIFALLSEIPFDLTIRNGVFDPSYNNVIITLLIAFLTIWGLTEIKERIPNDKWLIRGALMAAIAVAGCMAAHFLKTDYGAVGVLTVLAFYVFYGRPIIAMTVAVAILAIGSWTGELAALFNLPLIFFYNGERGRQSKYFFYAFYPGHLAILAAVCFLLGLGL